MARLNEAGREIRAYGRDVRTYLLNHGSKSMG